MWLIYGGGVGRVVKDEEIMVLQLSGVDNNGIKWKPCKVGFFSEEYFLGAGITRSAEVMFRA